MKARHLTRRFPGLMTILSMLMLGSYRPVVSQTHMSVSGDWPTYLFDNARTGFNGSETIINRTSASNLKLKWKVQASGSISSQVVEANGAVYWGAWGGYEHAAHLSDGAGIWKAALGQTIDSHCSPSSVGVANTATVSTVLINGTSTPVVFVGGGDGYFYALNANTGRIIWQTLLGSPPSHFLWSSPAVYNGSVYEGVSSLSDCPLIRGQLVQLNASTGSVQHIFNVVPAGCLGGSIWGSPTIDAAGTVYVATGNPGSCSVNENYAPALLKLDANLSLIGFWQIPQSQQISDSDFGSTPTLFTATIDGTFHQMVGLINKNGIYYAFDRTSVSSGPLWQANLAMSNGGFSSSAWDGTHLYVASGSTTLDGTSCAGSLRSLNPANGAFLWQHCLSDSVQAAVTAVPGLAIVGAGSSLFVVNTTTGTVLFTFHDSTPGAIFWGPATISNGVLYQGNKDGYIYAFSP